MSTDHPWFVRAFDAAYLEVYAHRDAAEAETATRHLLEPLQLAGKRVLDLACGGGRYTVAVARCGAAVTGLDLSLALLAVAQQTASAAHGFVRGHMLHLPFAARTFDLVLSMFTSFGYMPSVAEDMAVLHEVRRVLRPEGMLVLDLANAHRLRLALPAASERQAGRYRVREQRSLEPSGVVVKSIELDNGVSSRCYEERVRLWPYDLLQQALQAAGLPLRIAWGSYAGEAYAADTSERLVVLAGSGAHAC